MSHDAIETKDTKKEEAAAKEVFDKYVKYCTKRKEIMKRHNSNLTKQEFIDIVTEEMKISEDEYTILHKIYKDARKAKSQGLDFTV